MKAKILLKKVMAFQGGITSESKASRIVSGTGSGLNSSGTKLSRTLLIIGTPNVGHTFRKIYLNSEYGESHF